MNAELFTIAKGLKQNEPYKLVTKSFMHHIISYNDVELFKLDDMGKFNANIIVDALNGAYVSGMMDLISKID